MTMDDAEIVDVDITQQLWDQKEIWVQQILPFLGMGQYAFVAPVSHGMKDRYQEYCESVKNPPIVITDKFKKLPTLATYTFYSAAFHNKATTKYWWFHDTPDNRAPRETDAMRDIAKVGNQEAVLWALQVPKLWNGSVCEGAAEGGHLELLQWAQNKGYRWCERTCTMAARGGHLELLQ